MTYWILEMFLLEIHLQLPLHFQYVYLLSRNLGIALARNMSAFTARGGCNTSGRHNFKEIFVSLGVSLVAA